VIECGYDDDNDGFDADGDNDDCDSNGIGNGCVAFDRGE
jgi:hypothetical protein